MKKPLTRYHRKYKPGQPDTAGTWHESRELATMAAVLARARAHQHGLACADRIEAVSIGTGQTDDGRQYTLWAVAIIDRKPHPVTGQHGRTVLVVDWATLEILE